VVPIKDYSGARYWALGPMGYGKGFTAFEAVQNYVSVQLRNFPAKTTVFKTRAKFKAALEGGEVAAKVLMAPEGYDGFVHGMGSWWTDSTGTLSDTRMLVEHEVLTDQTRETFAALVEAAK
jgi:hypothetical protein